MEEIYPWTANDDAFVVELLARVDEQMRLDIARALSISYIRGRSEGRRSSSDALIGLFS